MREEAGAALVKAAAGNDMEATWTSRHVTSSRPWMDSGKLFLSIRVKLLCWLVVNVAILCSTQASKHARKQARWNPCGLPLPFTQPCEVLRDGPSTRRKDQPRPTQAVWSKILVVHGSFKHIELTKPRPQPGKSSECSF